MEQGKKLDQQSHNVRTFDSCNYRSIFLNRSVRRPPLSVRRKFDAVAVHSTGSVFSCSCAVELNVLTDIARNGLTL
jgi:hypothetical protein